jgi:CubicO group peptidase (beta-lactamase class C family)
MSAGRGSVRHGHATPRQFCDPHESVVYIPWMRQSSRRCTHARAALCLVSAVLLASCSKPTTAAGDLAQSLDGYFRGQFPPDEPGGAVLVAKRDRVVFARGYGLADLKTRQPISTQTLFNLGSITKTFVANAILLLQEQGKLSVEDNLLTYFPGFKHKDIASQVKLKHLLTHTSGLPDNREVAKNVAFYLTAKDAESWYPVTQADALVFEPGSRFEYSNPAYNALALVIEQVSGTKWQTFVKDKIFRPAGMTTSTITDGSHPETGVAHGYVKEHGQWAEADYGEVPTFAAAGNGGGWSSVEDLARYEQALRKSVFLSPGTIADSRTVKQFSNWVDANPPKVGWSWFVKQTDDQLLSIGHEGSQGGFLCSYLTLPEKDILIVILTNTPRDEKALVHEVMQALKQVNWLD